VKTAPGGARDVTTRAYFRDFSHRSVDNRKRGSGDRARGLLRAASDNLRRERWSGSSRLPCHLDDLRRSDALETETRPSSLLGHV
jgi:hypothetical protein